MAQEATAISSFRELAVGDLVVHIDFGVGRYLGLERMDAGGVPGDFLAIEYADADKLYLPVYRLSRVQKYVGSSAFYSPRQARGNELGTNEGAKVKRQLQDIAGELLSIQAERAARVWFRVLRTRLRLPGVRGFVPLRGDAASVPGDSGCHLGHDVPQADGPTALWRRRVRQDRGIDSRRVQGRARRRTGRDSRADNRARRTAPVDVPQSSWPTPRLGSNAPADFGHAKELKQILADTAEGKVDVLIGTHRILSKDIEIPKLGLLIIDEEQRFGVRHKERLKSLRANIDVLTMTATPIPRTLEMSLLGIRDLSVILTPPPGRMAIRTHIAKFKDSVLREGIEQELERGGQVFFVHNRVDSIYNVADEIRRIVPWTPASPLATRSSLTTSSKRSCSRSSSTGSTCSSLRRSSNQASTSRARTRSSSTAPTRSGSRSCISCADGSDAARTGRIATCW